MSQPQRFADRVAIVTGAASGIGEATVRSFAREGAHCVLIDINEEGGEAVARSIRQNGGEARFVAADVSKIEDCRRAVERAVAAFDTVHYLVNCAVSFIAKGLEVTPEEWRRSLSVNVQGGANMVQMVVPEMRRAGGGAIVNVASISGYIAQPDRWTYNATKGAILTLTKCQALDLSPDNIRVNSVSPGWTWTPEVAKAAAGDREKWEPIWGRFHMLRRLADAREVAMPILFLCSEDASFITAADLAVDGGYLGLGSEGLGESSSFAGSE